MIHFHYDGVLPVQCINAVVPTVNDIDVPAVSRHVVTRPRRDVSRGVVLVDDMSPHDTCYDTFVRQVNDTPKSIVWRYHDIELDVVAMNEYNIDSGALIYNRFVHVIREKTVQGSFLYRCTCNIYNFSFSDVAGDLLHNSNHCLHCSFFSDVVEKHVSNLFSDEDVNESYIFQILKQSVIFLCYNVTCLSNLKENNLKFSVIYEKTASFLDLNVQDDLIICKNSSCSIPQTTYMRKKVSKFIDEDEHQNTKLCPHLKMIQGNEVLRDIVFDKKAPSKKKVCSNINMWLCV